MTEMDLQSKKKYIFHNISLLKDNNEILNYFNKNNLNYTINNNGIFINLTTLGDDPINFIYLFLCSSMKIIPDHKPLEETDIRGKTKSCLNDNYIKDFTKKEQEIIRYSKKEKLF